MPIPQQQVGQYSYDLGKPIDIGSGYAAGITSAGQAISKTITGLMGGIDEKGQIQQGILGQNQTTNDFLTVMNQMKNPDGSKVLGDDAYQSLMGKSLGAKQMALGMYQNQFMYNLQQQAQQNREIAVAQGTARAQAPYRSAEIAQTAEEARKTAVAGREATGERRVTYTAPAYVAPPNPPAPVNNTSDFNKRFPQPANSLSVSLGKVSP
jgi:hypothetical protein